MAHVSPDESVGEPTIPTDWSHEFDEIVDRIKDSFSVLEPMPVQELRLKKGSFFKPGWTKADPTLELTKDTFPNNLDSCLHEIPMQVQSHSICEEFARLKISTAVAELDDPNVGQITSLGKFFIDDECREVLGNFINKADVNDSRVQSERDAGKLYDRFLQVMRTPGVAGYLVIGYDGLVQLNMLPSEFDPDLFAAWGLMTFMQAQQFAKALGHNTMRQLVHRTENGSMLLGDFGEGILVAISDKVSTEDIVPLIVKARKAKAA